MQNHKATASYLRHYLKGKGFAISHSHALEITAAIHGLPDWNTLCALPNTPTLTGKALKNALQAKLYILGAPEHIREDNNIIDNIISNRLAKPLTAHKSSLVLPEEIAILPCPFNFDFLLVVEICLHQTNWEEEVRTLKDQDINKYNLLKKLIFNLPDELETFANAPRRLQLSSNDKGIALKSFLKTLFNSPVETLTLIYAKGYCQQNESSVSQKHFSLHPKKQVDGIWAVGISKSDALEQVHWLIADLHGLTEGSKYPHDSRLLKKLTKGTKGFTLRTPGSIDASVPETSFGNTPHN